MYISWDPSNTIAPLRQLAAFRRVSVKNGETVTIQMAVSGDQMAVWVNDAIHWNVLPGMVNYSVQYDPLYTDIKEFPSRKIFKFAIHSWT